jgi:putative ABC transport system substrate-binding protein
MSTRCPVPGRRRFILGACSGFLISSTTARAQLKPATERKVGVLSPGPDAGAEFHEALQMMQPLGWMKGKNISLEPRSANGNLMVLRPMALELAALGVDVIVTYGTDAALAAKSATTTIAIVMASAGDPVGTGLVASLARPGANITGFSIVYPEIAAKRAALLHELLPAARRVCVLINPLTSKYLREVAEAAYRSLAVEPLLIEVASESQFRPALVSAVRSHAEMLDIALALPMTAALMEEVLRHRLPAMVSDAEFVEAGALLSFAPSITEGYRRVAAIVDRVLRGANPSEIPIEQPTEFDLTINLRTARALDISVPSTILARADKLIR